MTTTLQSTHLSTALTGWMQRERLTVGRAARWLGIRCSDLEAWQAGSRQPSAAEITRVLTQIAMGNK